MDIQQQQTPAPSPSVEPVSSAAASQSLLTIPSMEITAKRAVILALVAAGLYKRELITSNRRYALSFAALVGVLIYNERQSSSEAYCSMCGK